MSSGELILEQIETSVFDEEVRDDTTNSITHQTSKPHVLSIVPRGEVIRNFVYSGCFDVIARNAKLSLLSVSINSEMAEVLRGPNRSVNSLEEVEERWMVRFQREILDLAHGRWLWSKASQERWRLRDHEARKGSRRTSRSIKKALALPFASDFGLKVLSASERFSSKLLNPTRTFIDLYRSVKPSLVFNGSHIHSAIAIPAVQAAQWLGIPTATFIFSWDNLTSQGRIILPYDYFFVWNETLKRQLLEMYDWIKPENVFVTGTPQFDLHFREESYLSRKEYCKQIGADHNRPLVLYTTGMANHMPGEPEIVEGIADMLAAYPKETRPQLLVRVYAKDLTGRFDDLRRRRSDILFADPIWEPEWLTPKPEDSIALVNALQHCALGINVASTISLELCMFNKPVINVGYDPPCGNDLGLKNSRFYAFEHYKPVVDSGAVDVAWNTKEMTSLIDECLICPEKRSMERKRLLGQMFGPTLDGKSGKRVADLLIRLAE